MGLLKKSIGFVIGFAVVYGAIHLIGGDDELKEFESYHSDEGRFSALFPGKPTKIMQSMDTPAGKVELVMYQGGAEETGFIVGYCDYPQEVIDKPNLQKILDGARDGAIRNIQGELIEETKLEFHGYIGREIKIKAPQDLIIKARMILIDNRLYQVMVVSPSADIIEEKGAEFLESFSVDGTG